MSLNSNKYYLKKEIQISTEQITNEENTNQLSSNKVTKQEIEEEINKQENDNEIILNQENKEELNNNNNYDNSNEIYIINKNIKPPNNKRKQQSIYTKIRTESYRNPKSNISTYIYKSRKVLPKKNDMKNNYNKYIINTAKYSIKNPIKEKSKNKYKKNKINETEINNDYSNYNYNINLNEISNVNDYGYNNYINKTNYIYSRENEITDINNINDDNVINIVTKSKKPKNKKIINLQNKNQPYISFNAFNKLQDTKNKFVPKTTKGEGRITYICDYSQENNKDSYYVESPNNYPRHISIYPIEPKLKKRKNKGKKYKSSDKLKKEIEVSKKKFEKIREIEREIKNYFNLNGIDILNRELYDQSATMIQATFRAYFSRKKLYDELNLYINIKNAIDILKEIFQPKKKIYWENFINAVFEYITELNSNIIINDNNTENEVNLNNEKYQDLNDEFNSVENNPIKYIKKKPTSYKYKKKSQNKNLNNPFLIPQSCISFNFDNNDEIISNQKSSITNNNIIKDTQESVELKLNEELKDMTSNNNDIKLDKLKYALKVINLKYKEQLYKYFMKLYYYSWLLKFISELNDKKKGEKNKILKKLVINKEKYLNNIKKKNFLIFYFKGLINKYKSDNLNKTEEKEKEIKEVKDENNKEEQIDKDSNKEIENNE